MDQLRPRVWLLLAILATTAISSPSFADVNLLANPGFEANGGSYNGWFTFGSGVQLSLPGGDNIIRTGVAASKIYGEFSGCPSNPQFSVGGYGQAFTPIIGREYEARGYSYISSADPIPGTSTCDFNRLIVKIVFFNAASGGAEISSNEIVIGDHNSITNRWLPFSVSAPAPAGALRVEVLFLYLQPGCDTGAVFVDDTFFGEHVVSAEPNLLANPSFSTNLNGWTRFGNVFHDSRAIIVRTPTGSAKMFSSFVADVPSGMYQTFAASAGSAWQLDVYSMTTCREDPITGSNDNTAVAKIVFRNSSGVELGAVEAVILDKNSPLGTWTKHTVIANGAPAGTVAVEPFLIFVSPSLQGGAMWVDDARFEELNPASAPSSAEPLAFELRQNVPNPFGPSTRIDFFLQQGGPVAVDVYDVAGRSVAELFRGAVAAGSHSVTWDGKTATGVAAPSGIYRYVLRTDSGQVSRSLMLTR